MYLIKHNKIPTIAKRLKLIFLNVNGISSKIWSAYIYIPEKNVAIILVTKFSLKSGDIILNLDNCNRSTINLKF